MKKVSVAFGIAILIILIAFIILNSLRSGVKVSVYPDFIVNIVVDDVGNHKRGNIVGHRLPDPSKEDVELFLSLAEKNSCPLTMNILFSDRELVLNWGWRSYFNWLPDLCRKHTLHEYTIHGRYHTDYLKREMTEAQMETDLILAMDELETEGLKYHHTHVLPRGVFDKTYLKVAKKLNIRTIRGDGGAPYFKNFWDKSYLKVVYKFHLKPLIKLYNPYRNREGLYKDVYITYWEENIVYNDSYYSFTDDAEKEKFLTNLRKSIDLGNKNRWSPWSWMTHWFNFIGGEKSSGYIMLKEAFVYLNQNYNTDETRYFALWETGEYFRELMQTKIKTDLSDNRLTIDVKKPTSNFDTPILIQTDKEIVTDCKKLKLEQGWKIYIPKEEKTACVQLK